MPDLAKLTQWVGGVETGNEKNALFHSLWGYAYCRAGDYSHAVDQINQAVALRGKEDLFDGFMLALANHHLGNRAEARAALTRAVDAMRQDAVSEAKPAVAKSQSGKPARATWQDRLGRTLLSQELEALLNAPHRRAAEEHLAAKEWARAIPHLDRLIEAADAKFWPDLTARGDCYAEIGDLEKACADYARAIALEPNNANVHYSRGIALRAKKQFDDAIAAYRKAIAINPKFAEAHCNLGEVLRDQGKLAESLAEYRIGDALGRKQAYWSFPSADWVREAERVLDLDGRRDALLRGDTAGVKAADLMAYALCRQRLGKRAEAIALLQQTVALQPDLADAHANLSWLLQDQGTWDKANAEIQKAIELNPGIGWYHNTRGWSLQHDGRLREALAEYRTAMQLPNPGENAAKNLKNAESLLRLDGRRSALLGGETAGVKATDLMAYALFRDSQGKVDEAVALLQRTVALQPDLADAHGELSWRLQRQGKGDQAVAEAQRAIELNPRVAWYHNDYGVLLENQGRLEEALAEYRKAVQLPNERGHAARNLKRLEPLVARIARLEAVRKGEVKPRGAAECLELAQLATSRKHWRLATRLYDNAFTDKPDLSGDLKSWNRYNAACAAALAAAGHGIDADKLDDKERGRLRQQALTWLRADLALWGKRLASGAGRDRQELSRVLQHWQRDSDFASVRGTAAIAKLPTAQQEPWRTLWADVALVLKKVQGNP